MASGARGAANVGGRGGILPKARSPEETKEAMQQYLRESGIITTKEKPIHWSDKNWFSIVIGIVIIANTLMTGFEVDDDGKGEQTFYIMNQFFCVIYVLELAVRLKVHRKEYFRNPMNCTDFLLVVLAVIDNWILGAIGGDGMLSQFTILRIMRFARVVRVVRMLSLFKEMWLIVAGLVSAARTLVWVMMLLATTLYVCGILSTMVFSLFGQDEDEYGGASGDEEESPIPIWDRAYQHEYFGSVPRSCFTLFQVLTLDHWAAHIARPVMEDMPTFTFFILMFIGFTSYGMMNVVIGVLVQHTVALAQTRQDRASRLIAGEQKKLIGRLKDFFQALDTNNNGILEREELAQMSRHPKLIRSFKQIDLPVPDHDHLFKLLDTDRKGEIPFEDFIMGCMKLKTPPSSTDMMKITVSMGQCVSQVVGVEGRSARLKRSLQAVSNQLEEAFRAVGSSTGELEARIPEVDLRRSGRIGRPPELEHKRLQKAKMRTHVHPSMHPPGSPVKNLQRALGAFAY